MIEGCDYSFARPSPSALAAAGKRFAGRYYGGSTEKQLTKGEAVALGHAGLEVVAVWESTAGRALAGDAAGRQDAHDARAHAELCGQPAGAPIFYAVDVDPTGHLPAILDYFHGVAAAAGGRAGVGIYGGRAAVQAVRAAGLAAFGWQTRAWSLDASGVVAWSPLAALQQYGTQLVDGTTVDTDRATSSSYGGWNVAGTTPAPAPGPAPEPHPTILPLAGFDRHRDPNTGQWYYANHDRPTVLILDPLPPAILEGGAWHYSHTAGRWVWLWD